MYREADAAALKGPPSSLQNRLLFHLSHKVPAATHTHTHPHKRHTRTHNKHINIFGSSQLINYDCSLSSCGCPSVHSLSSAELPLMQQFNDEKRLMSFHQKLQDVIEDQVHHPALLSVLFSAPLLSAFIGLCLYLLSASLPMFLFSFISLSTLFPSVCRHIAAELGLDPLSAQPLSGSH